MKHKRGDTELNAVAYEGIKRDVTCCVLRPGSEVTEAELSARYGLGRAPIRSALARLRQEGLVRALPRRGFVIAPITLRSVHDNFAIRAMLEPGAAEMAVGKVDIERLKALQGPYPLTEEAGTTLAFIRANREFHVAIAAASGNRKLTEIISSLIDEVDRILHLVQFAPNLSLEERMRDAGRLDDHSAIIAAFEAQDPAAARAATAKHVEVSRDVVMSTLLKQQLSAEIEIS